MAQLTSWDLGLGWAISEYALSQCFSGVELTWRSENLVKGAADGEIASVCRFDTLSLSCGFVARNLMGNFHQHIDLIQYTVKIIIRNLATIFSAYTCTYKIKEKVCLWLIFILISSFILIISTEPPTH
jgi:hypothetical protein